jgi:hypothetical protein
MAIPSNGNFRIRVIWVLREIDGREDDLRALVKTSAKGVPSRGGGPLVDLATGALVGMQATKAGVRARAKAQKMIESHLAS